MAKPMRQLVVAGTPMLGVPYKHVNKYHWVMDPNYVPKGKRQAQVYTYIMENQREQLHIQIEDVWAKVQANPQAFHILTCQIPPDQIAFVMKHNGVEMAAFNKYEFYKQLHKPGLLLWFPNEEATIIDGNHRFVARGLQLFDTMDFFVVTPEQIEDCLLDLPDDYGTRVIKQKLHE